MEFEYDESKLHIGTYRQYTTTDPDIRKYMSAREILSLDIQTTLETHGLCYTHFTIMYAKQNIVIGYGPKNDNCLCIKDLPFRYPHERYCIIKDLCIHISHQINFTHNDDNKEREYEYFLKHIIGQKYNMNDVILTGKTITENYNLRIFWMSNGATWNNETSKYDNNVVIASENFFTDQELNLK